MKRKVILFIATSLDGFIASENGDISWLSMVETSGEDYGYGEFIESVDTIIMGRKTYDKVLSFGIEFPHKGRKCYIITHSPRHAETDVDFFTGNLKELVLNLKNQPGKNIFIDGGAQIVNELMKSNLIDDFIISIIPIFLGSGIPLFHKNRPELKLSLQYCKSYPSGLVQLKYESLC